MKLFYTKLIIFQSPLKKFKISLFYKNLLQNLTDIEVIMNDFSGELIENFNFNETREIFQMNNNINNHFKNRIFKIFLQISENKNQ